MDTLEITNIVLAVTSIITAIIMIITLIITQRENKRAYKPDLIICKQRYRMKFKERIQFDWDDGSDNWNSITPFINMFNIGLGTAKQVKIKWSFDITSFLNIVKEKDKKSEFMFSFDKEFVNDKTEKENRFIIQRKYSHNHEKGLYGTTTGINGKEDSLITYILPMNVDKSSHKIFLPESYTKLYGILLYLVLKHPPRVISSETDIWHKQISPTLYLTIEYQDITNKNYFKKIEIRMIPLSNRNITGKEVFSTGKIEVSEQPNN